QLADARRQHVPHPLGAGAIGERQQVAGGRAEHVDGRSVAAARAPAHVDDHPEAGQAGRHPAEHAVGRPAGEGRPPPSERHVAYLPIFLFGLNSGLSVAVPGWKATACILSPTLPRTGRSPGPTTSRQAILEAARHQFAQSGYELTSIRAVAAAAGVDAALVVHFFGTKDELFRAAVAWPFDPTELAPRIRAAGPAGLGGPPARVFPPFRPAPHPPPPPP